MYPSQDHKDQAILQKIEQLFFELDKDQIYRKPQTLKHKILNKFDDRLYNKSREKQQKFNQSRREKQQQDRSQNKNFKVENNTTLKIMNKKPIQSITNRAQHIILQRERRLLLQRIRQEKEQRQKQQQYYEDMKLMHDANDQTIDQEYYLKKKQNYNLMRIERRHDLALDQLNNRVINDTHIHMISSESNRLIKTRPQYAEMDFLQRQKWFEQQRKRDYARLKREFQRTVTPFEPNVSQQNRLCSQRDFDYRSRSSDSLNKSPSKLNRKQSNREEDQITYRQQELDVTFSTPRDDKSRRTINRNNTSPQKIIRPFKTGSRNSRINPTVNHSRSVSQFTQTNHNKNKTVFQKHTEPHFGGLSATRSKPVLLKPHNAQEHASPQPSRVKPLMTERQQRHSNTSPKNPERQGKLRELINRHRKEVLAFVNGLIKQESRSNSLSPLK